MPTVPTSQLQAGLARMPTPYQRESGVPTRGMQQLGGAIQQTAGMLAQLSEEAQREAERQKKEDEKSFFNSLSNDVENANQAAHEAFSQQSFGRVDSLLDEGKKHLTGLESIRGDLMRDVPEQHRAQAQAIVDDGWRRHKRLGYRYMDHQRGKISAANQRAGVLNGIRTMDNNPTDQTEIAAGLLLIDAFTEGMPEQQRDMVRNQAKSEGYQKAIIKQIDFGFTDMADMYLDDKEVQDILGETMTQVLRDSAEGHRLVVWAEDESAMIAGGLANDETGLIDEVKAGEMLLMYREEDRPVLAQALEQRAKLAEAKWDAEMRDWTLEWDESHWRDDRRLAGPEVNHAARMMQRHAPDRLWKPRSRLVRMAKLERQAKKSRKAKGELTAMQQRNMFVLQLDLATNSEKYKAMGNEGFVNHVMLQGFSKSDNQRLISMFKNVDNFDANAKNMKRVLQTLDRLKQLPRGMRKMSPDDDTMANGVMAYVQDRLKPGEVPTEEELNRLIKEAVGKGTRFGAGWFGWSTGLKAFERPEVGVHIPDEQLELFESKEAALDLRIDAINVNREKEGKEPLPHNDVNRAKLFLQTYGN